MCIDLGNSFLLQLGQSSSLYICVRTCERVQGRLVNCFYSAIGIGLRIYALWSGLAFCPCRSVLQYIVLQYIMSLKIRPPTPAITNSVIRSELLVLASTIYVLCKISAVNTFDGEQRPTLTAWPGLCVLCSYQLAQPGQVSVCSATTYSHSLVRFLCALQPPTRTAWSGFSVL